MRAEFDRGGFHQSEDAPFRCGVGAAVLGSVPSLGRCHHDDPPVIALNHLRHESPQGIGGAVQVVVDHIPPVGIRHFEERLPSLDRGIRHQNVDFAEFTVDMIGGGAKRGDVADVDADRHAAAAQAANLAFGLGEILRRGRLRGGSR